MQRTVVVTTTPDGKGYGQVGADGGIFTFGDAAFYGSLGADPPASPIVDMSPVAGGGYDLVDEAGQVFTFGPGAKYLGGG